MEYYLFYGGVALILMTLVFLFPSSSKREKEILSLLKLMGDNLQDLKKEIKRLKDQLSEKGEAMEGFKGFLRKEMAVTSREDQRRNGQGETTKHLEVKRLLDKGYDEDQIVKELNLGFRELRLILKMKGWG